MSDDERPHIEVRNIGELHQWLSKNHGTGGSTWLVTFKKAHPNNVSWSDVVEELMCWGWVDSSVRTIDKMRMKHLISPRKESSAWSAANKGIVAAMRKAGRMQPSGETKVAAAKANGMWAFLDDVERLEVPDDLGRALGPARPTWEDWTRSVKRGWLEQIKRAKTPATR